MEYVKSLSSLSGLDAIVSSGNDNTSSRPIVLFIDTQCHTASGVSRLHTTLARELANNGYNSVRLRKHANTTMEAGDLSLILDALGQEFKANRFVIYSSGAAAELSIPTTIEDNRISGLYLIDAIGFRTRGFYFHHYLLFGPRRLFNWQFWTHPIGKYFFNRSDARNVETCRHELIDPSASINEKRYLLWSLFHKNVKTHFVFTGGVSRCFNHQAQFPEMCEGLYPSHLVSHTHLPFADQLLIQNHQRAQFIDLFVEWIINGFPVETEMPLQEAA